MNFVTDLVPLAIGLTCLAATAWLAARPHAGSLLWLAPLAALSCLLPTPLVLITALLVLVLVIWRRTDSLSSRAFRWLIGTATAGTLLFCGLEHRRNLNHLDELRAEHPFLSIAPRLASVPGAAAAIQKSQGAADSPEIRKRLDTLEEAQHDWYGYRGSYRRERTLQMLHDRVFDTFVKADGFGVMRGPHYDPDDVRLPRVEPIRLVCEPRPSADNPAVPLPDDQQLHALHWTSSGDFLQQLRLGFVRDRDHVAGFQPHAFTGPPRLERQDDEVWRVSSVALVSLLKHEQPCVYETDALPNLENISSLNAPTRELDSFESGALRQLWTNQDLVIDDTTTPNTIRMLGSLRAAAGCCVCHDVPRGTLLGAFSYRLIPRTGDTPLAENGVER